jgi:ATP-dependent Clp protease ATP-binding subunit ClpA
MDRDEAERLLELEKELHKKVVSQNEAIEPSARQSAARAAA